MRATHTNRRDSPGFKSKAQWRYCFATQGRHPTWDCHKEAHETKGGKVIRYQRLPRRKGVRRR